MRPSSPRITESRSSAKGGRAQYRGRCSRRSSSTSRGPPGNGSGGSSLPRRRVLRLRGSGRSGPGRGGHRRARGPEQRRLLECPCRRIAMVDPDEARLTGFRQGSRVFTRLAAAREPLPRPTAWRPRRRLSRPSWLSSDWPDSGFPRSTGFQTVSVYRGGSALPTPSRRTFVSARSLSWGASTKTSSGRCWKRSPSLRLIFAQKYFSQGVERLPPPLGRIAPAPGANRSNPFCLKGRERQVASMKNNVSGRETRFFVFLRRIASIGTTRALAFLAVA
jgi:hypothetical protein